jgi:uncharacterized membrane protein
MDMVFSEDAQDARAHSGRNLSEFERWASLAAGTGLAIYGLTRLKRGGWLYALGGGLLLRRGVSAHCDVYEALGLNTYGSPTDTRAALGGARGVHVLESVTINRPVEDLYRFWRNLANLPRIMSHVESVELLSDTRSRWRVRGPGGIPVSWEAEIINDQPPQLLAWRTVGETPVTHAGSVRFTPIGAATRIDVSLQYDPPGGAMTHVAAALMDADAGARIERDLHEFKRAVESGRLDLAGARAASA